MADLSGVTLVGGVPTNGVAVSAFKASRFLGGPPAYNAAPPAGAPDAGPVSSSQAFGGDGQWVLTTPTNEEYYVQQVFGGRTVWTLAGSALGAPGLTAAGSGLLAARPVANLVPAGYLYFATDVAGGTLYSSDGASTWTKVSPGALEVSGAELAYAEARASFTIVAGNNAPADIPASGGVTPFPSITFDPGTRPAYIDLFVGQVSVNAASRAVELQLMDEANTVYEYTNTALSAAAANLGAMRLTCRIAAGAGNHTYRIQGFVRFGNGTTDTASLLGGATAPIQLFAKQA